MRFKLQHKLLLLLAVVILIALSSSMVLRNFIIRDFKAFGEGRTLDRLYQVQAVLEGRYEQTGSWQQHTITDDVVWAWLSGVELKLYDTNDQLVINSGQALAGLSPVMQQRIIASSIRRPLPDAHIPFQSYPLFLRGEEIGRLDIRLPRPVHENFFIQASNRFLAYSVIGLGFLAVILSYFAARRISRPLQKLTEAAEGLAAGDSGRRVQADTSDEIGSLAATFNRMADRLEAQERLRKQLVSNAAHELRTPLMVIRGELEAMIDGLMPVTPEALQSLHDEAARLAAILDGVDELTKAQAVALGNLNCQQIQLVPYLKQVITRFERQAGEQNVLISIAGDEGVTARIDPDQFTRIIINLVNNALRAMPDGGQLTVLASSYPDKREITITDTGFGIQEDQLPHIFERFYKGKNGGLGLGLAIVKELVEAHGGTISATSKPGKGTCFLISLPEKQGERS